MSMNWRNQLDLLVDWARNKNYHVEFVKNGDDSVCNISKIIEINSALPIQTQVIRLLHECGHVLIFENGSSFNFESKRHFNENSSSYKVFTLIEEVEAWKRGRELSSRMKIEVEEDVWEKAMVRALKKYIDWASSGEKDEN